MSPAAAARRDNLDLFVKAVADFQAIDGQVTLPSLLAWLQAEDEMGSGLDQATPSEADSVKLLTVHRAKGLEWSSVFLVGVCAEKFPVNRARSQWTTVGKVLPAPLRGDAADVPAAARLRQAGDRRADRGGQGPPGGRGAPARLRRVHPGQARALGLVVPVEPDAAEAAAARRRTS